MLLYTVIMIVYTEIVVVFLTLLAVSNVNVIIQHRSTVYTCSRSILIPVYRIIINANTDFFLLPIHLPFFVNTILCLMPM